MSAGDDQIGVYTTDVKGVPGASHVGFFHTYESMHGPRTKIIEIKPSVEDLSGVAQFVEALKEQLGFQNSNTPFGPMSVHTDTLEGTAKDIPHATTFHVLRESPNMAGDITRLWDGIVKTFNDATEYAYLARDHRDIPHARARGLA